MKSNTGKKEKRKRLAILKFMNSWSVANRISFIAVIATIFSGFIYVITSSFPSYYTTFWKSKQESTIPQITPDSSIYNHYRISLFKYHGAENGNLQTGFSQFQGIIKEKIFTLVDEITELNPNCKYLDKLTLHYNGETSPANNYGFVKYWFQTEFPPLEILSGTLFSEPKNKNIIVKSRAHIENFSNHNSKRKLLQSYSINLHISPEEFRTTRDMHSLITLYALAMDAKKMKKPKDVIITYLSKAYEIAKDLKSSKDLNLPPLTSCIENELSALKNNRIQ